MAQQTDPRQIIVPVRDDIESEDHLQPQQSPVMEDSRLSIGNTSPDSELIRQRHGDLFNPKKGLEGMKNEEMMGSNSHANVRRNEKVFVKRLKSRLDAPRWGNSGEDEDWFLDEDVLVGVHPNKLSLPTLFQLVSLLLVMNISVCTLTIAKLNKINLWDLPLWKWEILISVIISGHLISGWGVRIIVFSIEQAFISKIRVLYFVYGTRTAVQYCIWLGLISIAWHYLVAEKMEMERGSKILPRVSKALLCLVVGSLVWLVKVFLVKFLASSFHNNTFFERAKMYLFKQYVIKQLSACQLREQSEEEDAVKVRGKTWVNNLQYLKPFLKRQDYKDRRRKLAQRKASDLLLKWLISTVQSGLLHGLSTLDEDLPDSSDDEDEKSLSSKAKKAARNIFNKVAKEGSHVIVLEDLKKYMRADKASLAMHLFKGTAGIEGITEESFTHWMTEAVKERRFLQLSLSDSKTAVDELHHLMDAIVAIIIVIISLLIFELAISRFIVLISSQLLFVGFIFQNTLKTTFEAIVFLFIMHPFDVGDHCEIDEVQMIVEEMNILTTAFERSDGQKIIYPNSVLATKPIGNYNRSPDMGDHIQFSIHISTPWEKIDTMKHKIESYIQINGMHWHPDPMILVKDVEDMNKLVMVVWPRHRMNHQNMGQRWIRRAALIDEMVKIFRELDIQYRMLPPDMNVRNMPAPTSNKFPSNRTACSGSD